MVAFCSSVGSNSSTEQKLLFLLMVGALEAEDGAGAEGLLFPSLPWPLQPESLAVLEASVEEKDPT
jgi:hypothetical protein